MKRIFFSMPVLAAVFCLTLQLSSGITSARPVENYPLVCRGSESLVIGIAPGERNIGFVFTRGTKPAGEGLAPGECSWVDRGMYAAEPDRVSQHVDDGSESLKAGGTLAPENLWYEELHSSSNYWTFMVANNGRGQLIAAEARPNRDREIAPTGTTRLPAGIGPLSKIELPNNSKLGSALMSEITVTDADIQALDHKLSDFTSYLPNDEQAAMGLLLKRAGRAPLDDPSGTEVSVSFFRAGSPRDNPLGRRGIVVQGGLKAILVDGGRAKQDPVSGSPGGRPPYPVGPLSSALGAGDVSIGPKHEDPSPPPPDTLTYIGPKHEDPSPPPPETINSLTGHLKDFSKQLSPPEQGMMDWLLQRAGSKEVREAAREQGPPVGTPGGRPPLLNQALGTARRGDVNRWTLRF
jgi:hypothetical protein